MSSTTTNPLSQNRYVWIQIEGQESTRVLCESHTEIIDDLKRKVFGDQCAKYKAFHHQQYLYSGDPIPADATDRDPVYLERIKNGPRKFSFS